MYVYLLTLFIDNRQTMVSIFKQQPTFYVKLSNALHTVLDPADFKTTVCGDGLVVESETPLERFEGSRFTINVNEVDLQFRVTDTHWTY